MRVGKHFNLLFMKLKTMVAVFLSCVFLLFAFAVNAQTPWVLDGNTNGAVKYIGNNDKYHFPIYTDNTQRVIVTDSGYVGIGTYDGSNNPTLPRNKVLVQNGTIWDPYTFLEGTLGVPVQSISFLSTSNRAVEGEPDVAILGLAVNDAGSNNVGCAGIGIGGSYNNGVTAQASGEGSENHGIDAVAYGNNEAENYGLQVEATGDGSHNYGIVARATGDGSENIGIQVESNGVSNDNLGVQIQTSGSTDRNTGLSAYTSGAADNNIGINNTATGATTQNTGIFNYVTGASATNFGVESIAENAAEMNISFHGTAHDSPFNKGLEVFATSSSGSAVNWGANTGASGQNSIDIGSLSGVYSNGFNSAAGSSCVGAWGSVSADSTSSCIGVIGQVAYTSSSYSYGVMGQAASNGAGSGTSSSLVGCAMCPVNFAGYFNGDVFCSNTYYYSDPKLKENIKEYKGALEKLSQLNIKQYTFKTKEFPQLNMPGGDQVGVLSTEMKKVFPNLVKRAIQPDLKEHKNNTEFESVNYNALIPVIIQATKELDGKKADTEDLKKLKEENEALKKGLEDLQKQIIELCERGCITNPGSSSGDGNSGQSYLLQNVPNPFLGITKIDYGIGGDYSNAKILIANLNGVTLQALKCPQSKGSVEVNLNDYQDGIYVYSLVVDGQIKASKQMVLSRD
jgi:hypothetical protein